MAKMTISLFTVQLIVSNVCCLKTVITSRPFGLTEAILLLFQPESYVSDT